MPEGTAAIPETGGAATFVRRASNDLAGFLTGWALFLDFLIVMALSALFVPHYVAEAISVPALRDEPWDAIVGCALIAAIAGVRLTRRTRLHVGSLAVAMLDLVVQGLLVVLGIAFLLSPETLSEGLGFAAGQDWGDLAFALPLAMLAYTGLETVANLAEEAREPGRTLPRSLFSAIGLVVVVTVLIAGIGLSAFPVSGGETALGEEWFEAPLVGIAAAFEGSLPSLLVDALRIAVGISGRVDPGRRGHDLRLRDHAAELFARGSRSAPARVRPARAAGARLERGDPDRGGARDRAHRRHRGR